MNYRIETIEGFRAIGYKRTYNYTNGENFREIPLFWQELMQNGKFAELMKLNNEKPQGALGICANPRNNIFDYYIAVASQEEGPEMEVISIKTQTYAIFPCTMDEIQDTTKRILAEWLPNSKYKHTDAPELEIYPDENSCNICIPITT